MKCLITKKNWLCFGKRHSPAGVRKHLPESKPKQPVYFISSICFSVTLFAKIHIDKTLIFA